MSLCMNQRLCQMDWVTLKRIMGVGFSSRYLLMGPLMGAPNVACQLKDMAMSPVVIF